MSKKLIIEIVKLHRLLMRMHFAHFLNKKTNDIFFFENERNEHKLL